MAELTTTAETTASSCCAPEQQDTCCEPNAKADCCDPSHGEGCDCAAQAPTSSTPDNPRQEINAVAALALLRFAGALELVKCGRPGCSSRSLSPPRATSK
jgi:hypothetical protein